MKRRLPWLLALAFLALVGSRAASAQPTGSSTPPVSRVVHRGARDVVDLPPGALVVPPLPPGYVTVRRGPLSISYPRVMSSLVQSTLARAEHDATSVALQLGLAEVPVLTVRLVPDPDTMRRLAPAAAPPPAYAVGVAYPALRLTLVSATAPRTWEMGSMSQVLRHELSHLLLEEAVGHADVPRWLAEGLAVEQAGEHSFERFQELAMSSMRGGVLPLRRLEGSFSEGPDQVNIAYAQSADFVAYLLRTDGTQRFALMLAHLRAGMDLDAAMREAYGASLAQIDEEWRHDLEGRYLLAPLWAGTGALWAGAGLLLVVAVLRKRRQGKVTMARWAREEKDLSRLHLTVVTPGAGLEPAAPRVDEAGSVPTISLAGERHTLH